jgi:hypothetical protein
MSDTFEIPQPVPIDNHFGDNFPEIDSIIYNTDNFQSNDHFSQSQLWDNGYRETILCPQVKIVCNISGFRQSHRRC